VTYERHFFEIPICRCSRDEHHAAIERKRDMFATLPLASAPNDRLRDIFTERYFTEWDYNEVVGWIRVFWLGPQLRAEYHLAKGTRHRLAQHRKFECCQSFSRRRFLSTLVAPKLWPSSEGSSKRLCG
jgi:hypothetical protein